MKRLRNPNAWSAVMVAALLVMFAASAQAATASLEWSWPTTYCDGTALDVNDIDQAEVFVDLVSIPSVTDGGDACAEGEVVPTTPVMQTLVTTATTVDIELTPGVNYFFRMRVQVNGVWSNLSGQAQQFIQFPQPGVPIIIRVG